MRRRITKVARAAVAVLLGAAVCAACGGGSDDGDGTATPCEYMGQRYHEGDQFPEGDNCNVCTCLDANVVCTDVACLDSGVPDAAGACAPTQGCPSGPACGGLCCGTGERCDNGVCKCGQNGACGANDECAAAGPIGGDACGSICCGASGPCPL